MGARTGQQVLERLRSEPPALWVEGELVADPTTHPRTANAAHSLAALYDLQHRPDLVDTMTFPSPTTGERVGMSFIVPRTREDLERRSAMHKVWADACLGFMGRMPDYLNVNLMGAGTAAEYFGQCRPGVRRQRPQLLRVRARERPGAHHALTNPQVDRRKQAYELSDPFVALGMVRETADGIIVRGARMLATLPISDEILIFPSTVVKSGDAMKPYALAFGIPNNTPACRSNVASRSTSGAATAIIRSGRASTRWTQWSTSTTCWCRGTGAPDERCRSGQPGLRRDRRSAAHGPPGGQPEDRQDQGVPRRDPGGHRHDRIRRRTHVQHMVAEMIMTLEIMKGLKVSSEAGATFNKYGVMTPARPPLDAARNWFPGVYKRLVEIMRLVTSSGLITIPTEADMAGPRATTSPSTSRAPRASAEERIALFRLAWDMSIVPSAVASRTTSCSSSATRCA